MPYAANGQISTDVFDGAVEITQEQYREALEGMIAGRLVTVDGGFAVIDPPEPEPEPEPEPLTPEQALAAERAAMVCSPAQMRLTLAGAGLLGTVQAIADANPQAAILWEYATQIRRNSPLIDALGGANGFEPEQIDDLFRAAMALDI